MAQHTQKLIRRYIRMDPYRPTPDEAVVLPSSVKVWAIVGQLRAVNGDIGRVARGYDVTEDGVRAAIAYYDHHAAVIDNRLDANVTPVVRAQATRP
ncbi:MAG: hypothetical protein ACRDJE_04830 [Dehalococcoidia bacterium]